MKKNSLFQIYSASKISNCLKLVKQAICLFPPRMVIAGLLMMMLTVTIIPARDSTAVGEARLLDSLEVRAGPGCFGPPISLEEGGWKYALSEKGPPDGVPLHTAYALMILTSELPQDRPASLDAVDFQTGSYRLLSGSVIGLHDDAGNPVASVSTSRANTSTL